MFHGRISGFGLWLGVEIGLGFRFGLGLGIRIGVVFFAPAQT